MKNKYDVVIIGGGIIGAAIAYEISKYTLQVLLVERNPLFADETSRGNSGIIHGGYDPDPGTNAARLNILGHDLWEKTIFPQLDFPRKQIDSLVIAFTASELAILKTLYQQGITNKVPASALKILDRATLLAREPNLSHAVRGALLCTSSWKINPVKATLALLGAAAQNNVLLRKNATVTNITSKDDLFKIELNHEQVVVTKNIINAAGNYADEIAKMAGLGDFKLTSRRGEYRILARNIQHQVNAICFMVPQVYGKGVIVAPMLDGRTMVGPSATDNVPKNATSLITSQKNDYIAKIGQKLVPGLELEQTEIRLAGSRPIDLATHDFIIRSAFKNAHFLNAAGMQSPALSSAPAIAIEIVELLTKNGTILKRKQIYHPRFKVMW